MGASSKYYLDDSVSFQFYFPPFRSIASHAGREATLGLLGARERRLRARHLRGEKRPPLLPLWRCAAPSENMGSGRGQGMVQDTVEGKAKSISHHRSEPWNHDNSPVNTNKQWFQPWFQSGAGLCPSTVAALIEAFCKFWARHRIRSNRHVKDTADDKQFTEYRGRPVGSSMEKACMPACLGQGFGLMQGSLRPASGQCETCG